MPLSSPAPITPDHNLNQFDCGEATINKWLISRAWKNEKNRASRTYVVCDRQEEVCAYYCLAAGAVALVSAPGKVRRNMPDPIPVMVLGRLGVDIRHQGKGLARALVRDAILRSVQAGEIAGVRALLVHALDAAAATFYERLGFMQSPIDPLVLMTPLNTINSLDV